MSISDLAGAATAGTISTKRAPAHKAMVIRALRRNGRVVGFIGEDIDEARAL